MILIAAHLILVMRLMLIQMMISKLLYGIYKLLEGVFKWVPDLGTSPGHEPITDQACGAVFFPYRAHRDLAANGSSVPMQWI